MLAIRRFPRIGHMARRAFATTTPGTFNLPHVIKPSLTEQKEQKLNARNLEQAVRHVHRDGLVVVEDVVPLEDLNHLNTKMVQDARLLQGRGENGPFNYNLGNIQQDAPPVSEFFSTSIFTSKFAPVVLCLEALAYIFQIPSRRKSLPTS